MKKRRTKEKRVIYYSDELNDDFAGTNIKKQRKVGKKFRYVHYGLLWNMVASVVYWCLAFWIFWIYQVVFKRVKIVNKKAIKKTKGGRFFYGNHTSIDDCYKPGLIVAPKQNRILANPDAVSIRGLATLVQMVGVIPVPNEISGMKKFISAIKHYNKWKYDIFIYPEAHIWPYYTGVRPFVDSSFYYPVMLNKPVYAFFTAYTAPKGLFAKYRKANATVYISDPFFPDTTKPRKEAQKELRDKVYNFMKECSAKYSTYKAVEYVKVEKQSKQTD